jgi:hypothetical protein
MAKIPQGNFGNVLPQISQTPAVDVDGGLSAGQQAFSNAATGVANTLEATADYEKRRQDAADKAEAIRIADRNEKVQTVTAHANIQNGLSDAQDQITADLNAGKLDSLGAMAAWKDKQDQIVQDGVKAVPDYLKPVVTADVTRFAGQLNNKLLDSFRANDQKQFGADLVTYQDQQERLAQKDIGLATQQYDQYIDNFGGDAGLDPKAQAKAKADFREKTRYTQAYSLISSSKDSIAGLEATRKRLASDEFLDVDPQKRAALENSVNTRITTLGQRAEAQAAAADRRRTAAFTSFSTFMESGRPPTPEYAVQVAAQFKGTPYEPSVTAMLKDGAETAGFASAPVEKQRAILMSESSKLNAAGSDPVTSKRFAKLTTIHNSTITAINNDPLTAALDRNVIPDLQPIKMDLASLPDQLRSRQNAADTVSVWTGKPVAPITKPEAALLSKMLEPLGPKEKAAALKLVSDSVGAKSMRAIGQLIDDPDIATAAGLTAVNTTAGRSVAEIYLDGKNAVKEPRVKIDAAKETGTKAQIYTTLKGVYPTQKATDQAADVIFNVWASNKAGGDDDMNRAVRMSTGAIVPYNGANIALPYGRTDTDLKDAVKAVTPDTLRTQGNTFTVGGHALTPEILAKQLPQLPLQTVGNGTYAVRVGGLPVMREDGRPLILNLGGSNVR